MSNKQKAMEKKMTPVYRDLDMFRKSSNFTESPEINTINGLMIREEFTNQYIKEALLNSV